MGDVDMAVREEAVAEAAVEAVAGLKLLLMRSVDTGELEASYIVLVVLECSSGPHVSFWPLHPSITYLRKDCHYVSQSSLRDCSCCEGIPTKTSVVSSRHLEASVNWPE